VTNPGAGQEISKRFYGNKLQLRIAGVKVAFRLFFNFKNRFCYSDKKPYLPERWVLDDIDFGSGSWRKKSNLQILQWLSFFLEKM
jgi:hypothetical protein